MSRARVIEPPGDEPAPSPALAVLGLAVLAVVVLWLVGGP